MQPKPLVRRSGLEGAEALRQELLALPPREQAALLGIDGPYDADLCPVCFDQDSTGCFSCGGTGKRQEHHG